MNDNHIEMMLNSILINQAIIMTALAKSTGDEATIKMLNSQSDRVIAAIEKSMEAFENERRSNP